MSFAIYKELLALCIIGKVKKLGTANLICGFWIRCRRRCTPLQLLLTLPTFAAIVDQHTTQSEFKLVVMHIPLRPMTLLQYL